MGQFLAILGVAVVFGAPALAATEPFVAEVSGHLSSGAGFTVSIAEAPYEEALRGPLPHQLDRYG